MLFQISSGGKDVGWWLTRRASADDSIFPAAGRQPVRSPVNLPLGRNPLPRHPSLKDPEGPCAIFPKKISLCPDTSCSTPDGLIIHETQISYTYARNLLGPSLRSWRSCVLSYTGSLGFPVEVSGVSPRQLGAVKMCRKREPLV
jgi:hypothetical protein